MLIRSWLLPALLAGFLLRLEAVLPPAPLREGQVTEEGAQALILSRIGDWAAWPPRPADRPAAVFLIGLLGDVPFEKELRARTAGLTAQGRRIEVRALSSLRPAAVQACDVLFIGDSEAGRLGRVLALCREHPVLTVSGREDWAREGVILAIYVKGGQLRLKVNQASARAAGIEMNSRFLATMRAEKLDDAPRNGR